MVPNDRPKSQGFGLPELTTSLHQAKLEDRTAIYGVLTPVLRSGDEFQRIPGMDFAEAADSVVAPAVCSHAWRSEYWHAH